MYVRTKKLNCCYAYFTWPSQENCVLHSSDLVPFFRFEAEPIKLNLTLCGRLLRWLVVSVQGRAWRELAGVPWGCHGGAVGMPRGATPWASRPWPASPMAEAPAARCSRPRLQNVKCISPRLLSLWAPRRSSSPGSFFLPVYFTCCFLGVVRPFLWRFVDTERVSVPEVSGLAVPAQAVALRGVAPPRRKERCDKPAAG